MRNLLLELRYDGSDFHGWQIQKDDITVQQIMTEAFLKVTGEKVNITGCSRTDTGVHANMYCCNLHSESEIPASNFPNALNFYLPPTISVYGCKEVDDSFHARFDAKEKEYIYLIYNGKYRNPFYEKRALLYSYKLDEKYLNEIVQIFKGKHDFSAFCNAGSDVEDKTRTIYDISLERENELVKVKIRGDGFLYNMVRIIVGTLLDISNGKIDPSSLIDIIESKDRNKAGVTAPAHGLYLNKVIY